MLKQWTSLDFDGFWDMQSDKADESSCMAWKSKLSQNNRPRNRIGGHSIYMLYSKNDKSWPASWLW
jgi:hypothetical protein